MARKNSKNSNLEPPPQDLEAEKSILGSILMEHKSLIRVADSLTPGDFYDGKNEIIFQSMLELFDKRSPIDVLTLSSHLDDKGKLEDIGGRAYIAELVGAVPTSTHIERYSQIVQEKSTLRKLIND